MVLLRVLNMLRCNPAEGRKQCSPLSLLTAEHFSTPYGTICELPQLGGSFFEPAHRPAGIPSLTLRCPIVPTEQMNAISQRTHDLNAADTEIRANEAARSAGMCNGSISCPCTSCSGVRSDLLNAFQLALGNSRPTFDNTLANIASSSEIVPLPPTDEPPRPPPTLPPRMYTPSRAQAKRLSIPAPVPEDVPTDFSFGPHSSIAPFRAIDLPLLSNPRIEGTLGEETASEPASESVSHISRGRMPGVVSTDGSEWVFAADQQNREWLFDETNLSTPTRRDVVIPIPDNTDTFEINTQASEASWAPIHGLGE